jgi:hypothetical protein
MAAERKEVVVRISVKRGPSGSQISVDVEAPEPPPKDLADLMPTAHELVGVLEQLGHREEPN